MVRAERQHWFRVRPTPTPLPCSPYAVGAQHCPRSLGRTLLFLMVCAVFPGVPDTGSCYGGRPLQIHALSPWAIHAAASLIEAWARGSMRGALGQWLARSVPLICLNAVGIAALARFLPDAAWICSAHALLTVLPGWALPFALVACTTANCPHAHESSIVLALLWPEALAYAVWLFQCIWRICTPAN